MWPYDMEVGLGVAIGIDGRNKSAVRVDLHFVSQAALPGQIPRPEIELAEAAGDIGVVGVGRRMRDAVGLHRPLPGGATHVVARNIGLGAGGSCW